jgi:hypothetical protein
VREELESMRDESDNAFLLHVRLENASVVSYKLNGRSAEHRVDLEETWGLDYEKIEFLYETARMTGQRGGWRSEFERKPGSEKRGSGKAMPDPAQMQKELSDLRQKVAAKGKGG